MNDAEKLWNEAQLAANSAPNMSLALLCRLILRAVKGEKKHIVDLCPPFKIHATRSS
jgi:hypothetical protein